MPVLGHFEDMTDHRSYIHKAVVKVKPDPVQSGLYQFFQAFISQLPCVYNCDDQSYLPIFLRSSNTVEHLSSATSFPKYQKVLSQITLFGTSQKRPRDKEVLDP